MREKKENIRELSTLLYGVFSRYKALYGPGFASGKQVLSETETDIARIIGNKPRTVVGDISKALNLPKSTVTGLIARLEQKGMISRSIHPDDLRTFVLELTSAGRKVVRDHEKNEEEFFAQLIEPLSERESRALIELLKNIAAQGGEKNGNG
ncbi:MAG: MarR family transcriptional regulator [Clostridiaceae bacterium]|nr:MarR family transcriptional regulator [Clostridiaceae bacterium]